VAVSDIALKQELPAEIGNDLMAYVGCIAGAILIENYEKGLRDAGFSHVRVIDSGVDLNSYAKLENQAGCCSPPMGTSDGLPVVSCCSSDVHGTLTELLSRYDVNDYAASVKVYAVKPR
jgi:hypothetical protein